MNFSKENLITMYDYIKERLVFVEKEIRVGSLIQEYARRADCQSAHVRQDFSDCLSTLLTERQLLRSVLDYVKDDLQKYDVDMKLYP